MKNWTFISSHLVFAEPVRFWCWQQVKSSGIARFSLGSEIAGVEWWLRRQGFQLKCEKWELLGLWSERA